jgi:hypothetical protein
MTLTTLFLIIALVLFAIAAIGVSSRIDLKAAGLAFCVAAALWGTLG